MLRFEEACLHIKTPRTNRTTMTRETGVQTVKAVRVAKEERKAKWRQDRRVMRCVKAVDGGEPSIKGTTKFQRC